MRKILLFLCIFALIPTLVYAAPTDGKTAQVGRLTFEYPSEWVGLSVEEGSVGIANKQSAIDTLVNGGTLAADEVVIVVINERYIEQQYYFEETPPLAEIAVEMQDDTGLDGVEYETISETDTEIRLEGENPESGMAATILVKDTGDGLFGMVLIAAAGQIREYEPVFQSILETLAYIPRDSLGFDTDAELTQTYTTFTSPSLTFNYPAGAIINELTGVVIVSNTEMGVDVGELQSGDVLVGILTDEFITASFGEEVPETDMDAAALMDYYRADIEDDDETELSEVNEMTIGDQTVFRTNLRDEEFDGILITLDTENGAVAALLATPIGEREQFERLFFEMVESIE